LEQEKPNTIHNIGRHCNTSASDEIPVEFIPADEVADDEGDHDDGSEHGADPEDEYPRDVGLAPDATQHRGPVRVQVVLQHDVRHHEGGDEVT
jgi:hypothetical protein